MALIINLDKILQGRRGFLFLFVSITVFLDTASYLLWGPHLSLPLPHQLAQEQSQPWAVTTKMGNCLKLMCPLSGRAQARYP